MKQPIQPPPTPQERKPGRSFVDPSRPLGQELLERSPDTTAPTEENFEDRATQAADQSAADWHGVAERAKVIGVLRKAEEFMSTSNPPPRSDAEIRRALELAGGRLGLTFPEYRALVERDPELVDLEARVIEDARRRWIQAVDAQTPASVLAPTLAAARAILDRVFVPVDYTMSSHRAVGVALELRRTRGSAVCLFHAAESSESDEWLGGIGSPAVGGDWVTEAENRLRRFLDNVAPGARGEVDVRARVGSPLRTLSEEAHDWGATVVVASASLNTRLFRSPAERLLRELGIPALIIPSDRD